MAQRNSRIRRYSYSEREEIANTVTHGFGLLLSLVAAPRLIVLALECGEEGWHTVSAAVYGTTLVLVYAASTLYHSARSRRRKHFYLTLDYICIYLLIAGTYTPFALVLLRGGWGWTLLGIVWGFAAVGIGLRLLAGRRFGVISTLTYVAMGWSVLIAARPVLDTFPSGCIAWVAAGGAFYMIGVVFYVQRREFMHTAWHVFVLGGSACHYVAVVHYVFAAESWV